MAIDRKAISKIVGYRIFVPAAMGQDQKTRLLEWLYPVQERIFQGVDEQAFAKKLFGADAIYTRIKVFIDDRKEPVGYCAVHRFEVRLHSADYAIFRAEAGIERAYRGRSSTFIFALKQGFQYKLLHPSRRCVFFCTLVHPSSYRLLTNYCPEIYPNHRSQTPDAVSHLMYDLADALGEQRVSDLDPSIREVGWITRDTPQESAFWSNCEEPNVRFFVKINPGYAKGEGLVTLVPLTLENLALSSSKYVIRRLFRE